MPSGTEIATAYVSLTVDASKVAGQIKQGMGHSVDDAANDARGTLADGIEEGASQGAEEGGKSITSKLKGALQGISKAAGGILGDLGIGGALAGIAAGAVGASQTAASLQAKLGLDPHEAAALGKTAGKVYADNWGESMADVTNTVALVKQQLSGLGNINLKNVTEQAEAFSQTFGVETTDSVRAVAQMLRTGMAKNATEAFDILTAGEQKGADKAGDLMDTMNEYSTQFRDLGLNGSTAMGIIQQGLQAGARDSDIVADALKELNIRVKDGTAAKGLQAIGLNADQMAEAFAKGGKPAADALQQITDRLRGVQDPAKRFQLAQQLLGTQSEDLSKALYAIDPSKATSALGDFSGSADKMKDAVGKSAPPLQQLQRGVQGVFNSIGQSLLPVMNPLLGALSHMGPELAGLGLAWAGLATTMKVVSAIDTTKKFLNESKAVSGITGGLGRLRDGFKSSAAAESSFSGRMGSAGGALAKVRDAIKSGITNLGTFSKRMATTAANAIKNAATTAAAWAKTAASMAANAAKAVAGWVAAGTKAAASAVKAGAAWVAQMAKAAAAAVASAATTAAQWVSAGAKAVGAAVAAGAAWIATQVRAAAATVATTAVIIAQAIAQKGIALATRAWAAAQWILDAAMAANPIGLIVIAIAALIAIIVVIATKTDWFQKLWKLAWAGIKAGAQAVADFFTKTLPGAFNKVIQIAQGVVNWIKGHWKQLLSIIAGPFGLAVSAISKHWGQIKAGALAFVGWIKGLPGRMVNALSSLGGKLSGVFSRAFSKAHSVVSGAIGTIVGAVRAVPGKISGLAGRFLSAGQHVIQSLINGLKHAGSVVSDIAGNVWSAIRGSLNSALSRLRSALSFTVHIGPFSKHIAVPVPALATGGRAETGTLAMIGEGKEAETVFPDSTLSGFLARMTDAATANLGAGGTSYALTITNWDEGTGYITAIADGRVDAASQLAGMVGRAS